MTTDTTPLHTVTDDALGDLDAVGVAVAIADGSISALEAAEAAIARVERVDPALNAVQTPDFDRARDQARAPRAGLLSGVPSFVKDNTAVAGLPTDQGSLATRSRPATQDDPFTQQLRHSGLVVLGKTTMPEFGFNASTEYESLPPTRNPWNTAFSPGGSSGGSAALVAAGAVPIAHANDGGGSIRIPAAACGLVGLKPTRGRVVPAAESKSLPVDIVSNGVVSRTVRDTAHFLAATQQFLPAKGLPPLGLVEGPGDRRLRVGLLLDSATGRPTDDDSRRVVTEAANLIASLGHAVEPVELPAHTDQFREAFKHYWSLLAFSTRHFGKQAMHSPDFDGALTDSLTQGLAAKFVRSFWRLPLTIRALKQSEQHYRDAFGHVDVVLSPVTGYVTPRLGYLNPSVGFETHFERLVDFAAFTPLHNANGAPGVSLPLGTSSEGMPVGVHVSAMHGDEQTLLELAYELEAAQPFKTIWG